MNNTITRIQLIPTNPDFISGYLDVDQRVPVPVTFAISDIRDPQKRTGSFSKTIKLPGTKNNNYLLGQLFDINIGQTTGQNYQNSFNVSRLYRCILIEDNVALHDNEMNLQLISVNKIQNSLTEDDIIEYEVLIRDDVGQFFSEVSNLKLTDLSFTEFNHLINANNIFGSWFHNWTNGYKYILPYKDNSKGYLFSEPILGIYAKQYWNKIHSDAGFTYEFYNNIEPNGFDQLVIPSNKNLAEQVEFTANENRVVVNETIPQITVAFPATFNGFKWDIGTNQPTTVAVLTQFNTVVQDILSTWTAPATWSPTLGTVNQYKVTVQFDYRFLIRNPNPTPIVLSTNATSFFADVRYNLRLSGGPGSPSLGVLFDPDTSIIQQQIPPIFNYTYPIGDSQAASNVDRRYINTQVIPSTIVGQTWFSTTQIDLTFNIDSFDPFELLIEIFNASLVIELDTDTLILNQIIDVTQTIPDVNQSDFLKSIYTMYNLYVVPDKNIANRLIYYTRDDFYRVGKELDWTHKMARDQEQKVEFLPELRNKELLLTYKEDDDEPNRFYTAFTKDIYGQASTIFNVEWTKGVDKKELVFSPTPSGISNFAHFLPYISRENNVRILLDNGNIPIPTNMIFLVNQFLPPNVIGVLSNIYPFFSHLNSPTDPTFDINFGENPYYFYDIGQSTWNNLFNGYWRNTVRLIDQGKMLTAYFWLDPTDIFQMDLNDRIRVDNSYWNINKIIDYDAGTKRLTKVELMSQSELRPTYVAGPTGDGPGGG